MTLLAELNNLRDRKEGWNGYDALPPNPKAIDAAITWLEDWYGFRDEDPDPFVRYGERPHITSSAEGEVVLEWWIGTKSLTVYIKPMNPNFDIDYVASWGESVDNDMEYGKVNSGGTWCWIWNWLWNGEQERLS